MHNNSEGLSPTLRANLGIGWNRALPAPFELGNGVLPDGLNDELIARAHVGHAMPNKVSFGIWLKTPAAFSNTRSFYFVSSQQTSSGVGLSLGISISGSGGLQLYVRDTATLQGASSPLAVNSTYYVVVNVDLIAKNYECFVNAVKVTSGVVAWTGDPFANPIQFSGLFRNTITAGGWPVLSDECALYNRFLTLEEIGLNYNGGVGNNQANTEGLLWWYDFQQAEADTALNTGGNPPGWTPGAWGVRDKSSNGYHAQQSGFAANNATLGGAIQPF